MKVYISGFVRSLGEWFGLPDPLYVLLYLALMIILLLVLLFLLCYSINTIYVIIFILLSILFIGSALILYYWIGIGSDDIPFYNDVVGYFNQTNTTHTAGFVPIRPIFPQTYVAQASFMETQSYERLTTLGHRLGKVADRLTTPSTPSKLLNVLFNTTVNRGVNVINSNSVFVQYHQ